VKIIIHFFRTPRRVIRITRKRGRRRLKRDLFKIQQAFAQERTETEQMLEIYKKFTRGNATEAEMKVANEQLVDLMKGLGIGVFAILPFAPLTIPAIIKLGKRLGIDVLPSAFYEQEDKEIIIEVGDKKSSEKDVSDHNPKT